MPTKDDDRKALGAFGETYAAHELRRRGYEILGRNVRRRGGEIDIVAHEGGELVFVEVKTRRPSFFGTPEDAITEVKSAHLDAAIGEYMAASGDPDGAYRVEFVAIEIDAGGRVRRFEVMGDVGRR